MEILDSSENTVGEYFGLEVNKNQNLVSFSNGTDAKKMDKMKTEWHIWLERNARTFRASTSTVESIIAKIADEAAAWDRAGAKISSPRE